MDFQIPQLLFLIPAPVIKSECFDEKGRLQLSLEDAYAFRKEYFDHVAVYLRSNGLSMEQEITPAVECALRLFNAENFTGELSPAEREHFEEIYKRFGAPPAVEEAKRSKAKNPSGASESGAAALVENTAAGSVDEEMSAELGCPIFASVKDAYMQRMLASDGEMASSCVRLGGLLLCVLAIVSTRENDSPERGSFLFAYTNKWRLRAHMRHQLCLMHRAHSVFLEISSCIDATMMQSDEDITVAALLEVGQAQNYYHRRELAAETFHRAMTKSGLQVSEDAVMGVRTRWQQQQYVQMVVNAQSARAVPEASTTEEQPKTVLTEKDGHDLLDRPREKPDAESLPVLPLHPEDKAIILALCMDIRNNNPYHGLTQHRMQTYVERLLADPAPSPFVISTQTLLTRSRLESRRNRVQERSFLQMTELVDQFSARRDPHHMRFARTQTDYFYCVALPPVWSLKSEYAGLCFEETLYKTALDTYEQVLDWEKINECCKKLDRRRRAESLARDLLEVDPSNPLLWVALGEATHEDGHLWKAWEVCQHKMAAPMRALARLALDREHYDKVVEYFDEAVKINPIFGGDWFTLGYASLKLQNWNRGGEAFTRVCQIDPNDAFAWNNLASIMLRDGKLRPAFNAMSQALRNNRRDWRMWQNYFQIGCRLKEVTETTNALHIALSIAKRGIALDRETLDLFVDNTIAYLKGEIPGSSIDAEENAEVKATNAVAYKSMTSAATTANSNGSGEEEEEAQAIEHLPVAAGGLAQAAADKEEEEGEGEGLDGLDALVPLGADEDLTRDEIYAASNAVTGGDASAAAHGAADNATRAALQAGIRKRYGERVRKLFVELMETFVSDPDLYACAARLFAFVDGTHAGYHYRLKELRACKQKDQWAREPALFARTVESLTSLAQDASDMSTEVQRATEQAAAAGGGAATAAAAVESTEPAGSAVLTALAATEVDASLVPLPMPTPEEVVTALKDTQNNVKAVLEAAEEHMGGTPKYEELRALAKSVRGTLQEAKAAFV